MPTPLRPGALVAVCVAVLLVGSAWVLASFVAPEPPVHLFETAQEALRQARTAEAERYAPDAYKAAEREWESAQTSWHLVHGRLFPVRAYDALALKALRTAELARHARRHALAQRDSLRWAATVGAEAARDGILLVHVALRRMPFDSLRHAEVAGARALLRDAEAAARQGDYLTAAGKVDRAAERLRTAYADVGTTLELYLSDLERWQTWQRDAVAWSAAHEAPALVVDKMARRLYVYVGGEQRHAFPVELGPSWMGPRRYEGDGATPEGRYRIARKHGPGATAHPLALELDYPGDEDRRRFAAERDAGTLPPDARIGGALLIHGAGGRGADWTEGSIALADPDVEAVFELARVGTPVVIVGTLTRPTFRLPPDPALLPSAPGPALL